MSTYELRTSTGAVLQASESLGALLAVAEGKRGETISRRKDNVVVWPPEAVNLDAT